MAIVWASAGTDETFDTGSFTAISGTANSDSSQAKDGNHSLGLPRGSSANRANVLADAGFRVSWWMRFDHTGSLGAGTPLIFRGLTNAGSAARLDLSFTTGTAYKLVLATTVGSTTGTAVLAANTWIHLCVVGQFVSASNWRFDVYVNGVLDISRDSLNSSQLGSFDQISFLCDGNTPIGSTRWFDNLVVEQGVTPADGGSPLYRVSAKRPIANGGTNTFDTTTSIDSSGYGTGFSVYVNQRPLSTNGARRHNAATGSVNETYQIEDAATGDRDLTSILQIYGYVAWVRGTGVATDTVWSNGTASVPSVPFSGAAGMRWIATTSSTYPSSTSAVGMGRPTGSATNAILNECGMLIVFTAEGDAITPGVDGGIPSVYQLPVETIDNQANPEADVYQTAVETLQNQVLATNAAQVYQIVVEVIRPQGCSNLPQPTAGCPTDLEFPVAPGDGDAGCSDELPVD